jgi:purine-nucleoside phosphorylase
VPYSTIRGFPATTVAGHAGELIFGRISGVAVVCMKGRFHSYEGHSMQTCTLPVRVAAYLGVRFLIVTNAAGGLKQDFKVGDVMIMSDHIFFPGLAGRHPLVGPNDGGPKGDWPRFLPLSNAYDNKLADLALRAAKTEGMGDFTHPEGVYAMVSGPSYETCAECRFLLNGGADAVGMSTAPEVIVARHSGLRVLGFSLITNKAVLDARSGAPPANHEEVLRETAKRAEQMQGLVRRVVAMMREEEAAELAAGAASGEPPAKQQKTS